MEKDMSLLKNISLFDNLGDAEITQILSICTQVSFGKDEIIMQEGDVGDTMYIIVKGTVEVAKTLVLQGMDRNLFRKIVYFSIILYFINNFNSLSTY